MTREEYQRAWEAYANEPTLAAVQRALSCGQEVAHRLVWEGLPRLGLVGLDKRLKDEARLAAAADKKLTRATEKLTTEGVARELEARARAVDKATRATVEVLGDAAHQRGEEAKLIRMNRVSAQALSGTLVPLLRAANRLTKYVDEALGEAETEGLKGKAALEKLGLKPGSAVDLVRSIATLSVRVAQVSEASVRMERLHLGEPTAVLGIQETKRGTPMTLEEAEQTVKDAARAFDRARQRALAEEVEVDDA